VNYVLERSGDFQIWSTTDDAVQAEQPIELADDTELAGLAEPSALPVQTYLSPCIELV
jgi:hypothetical protein